MYYQGKIKGKNDQYKAFLRSRYKDTDGSIVVIVGWKDGARPSALSEEEMLLNYSEISKEEYEAE